MTGKRFTLVYGIDEDPFEWDIMGNQKDILIVRANGTSIVDLLNELHEENEHLKESNQLLVEYSEYYRKLCIYFDNQINEVISENALLERENEQLKQQMQRLYNYFADWFDDRVPSRDFSEMWDFVKEDKKWD